MRSLIQTNTTHVPPEPLSEDEIIANWKGSVDSRLVSICCLTYNHHSYIKESLDGFLMQVTSFPFEVLIHDDASTDKTADIIKDYNSRYPNIVKPIFQIDNQFSQGIRPNTTFNFPRAQGKYIALCEGDDYWTDPLKLQKQVDYLESHPEVVISGHDAFIIEQNNFIKESKLPDTHKRDYSGADLILGKAWILTMSMVFRNVTLPEAPERQMVINGDKFLVSLLGNHGGSHYHTDIKPAAYRIHASAIWSPLSEIEKIKSNMNTFFWLHKYYQKTGAKKYADSLWESYLNLMIRSSIEKDGDARLYQNKKCEEKILIFGAGEGGKTFHERFNDKYEVIAFVDNNKNLHGKDILNLPVVPPENINTLNFSYVMVCSMHWLSITTKILIEDIVPPEKIRIFTDNDIFKINGIDSKEMKT